MYIIFLPFDWTRALSPVCFWSVPLRAGITFLCNQCKNMAEADGKQRYCPIESKPEISLITKIKKTIYYIHAHKNFD